ncbi:MAG: ABC transporter permease [Pseudomonadota bacterium]
MDTTLPLIGFSSLALAFIPTLILLYIMRRWSLNVREAALANLRMLAQLLLIGYLLTWFFETDNPLVVLSVVLVMLLAGAWISLQPLPARTARLLLVAFVALATCGGSMLYLVTQWVLDLPRWFEPRFVIPLAGMVFANVMNAMSIAAERFEAEWPRRESRRDARRVALQAALIPQINALLAVGLVSLPGMMTGQILAGTNPVIAVRYQIVVMCMVFSSGGLAAATFLMLQDVLSRGDTVDKTE